MTWTTRSLLDVLLGSSGDSFGILQLLLVISLPFALSFVIVFVYRRTQRDTQFYSHAFFYSLILFSTLASMMMHIVGNNVARAFGLIGALSIIRFRAAIKSPIDAVFIFWALALGMACGVGLYLAAFVLVFGCAALILMVHSFRLIESGRIDSILRLYCSADDEASYLGVVEAVLTRSGLKSRRINMIFNSDDNSKIHVYKLSLPLDFPIKSLQDELVKVSGVKRVQHLSRDSAFFSE